MSETKKGSYRIFEQGLDDTARCRGSFPYSRGAYPGEGPQEAAEAFVKDDVDDSPTRSGSRPSFRIAVVGPGGAYGEDQVQVFEVVGTRTPRSVVLVEEAPHSNARY